MTDIRSKGTSWEKVGDGNVIFTGTKLDAARDIRFVHSFKMFMQSLLQGEPCPGQ